MRQLLQMMKRRRSSWSEALIVAPGCDTVTIGQIGGTRLHTLNMRATDLQSGSESVAQLVSHIRHLHPRARRALLLLPRNQYAFKRFELPPCESKHLSEVMRNQLELRSSFGADRAYFDYVSISEHLQSASKQQMYGMYIAPRPLIDGWRVALNEAGLSLDQVTTQTQIAAETFGAKAASSGVLSVVSNNSGIELIYAWEGAVCATGFIESLPGENPNIVQLGAETARMRASLSAPMVVEEIHVVGDRDEAIAAVLIKMFPGLPVSASQSRATVGSNDGNVMLSLATGPSAIDLLRHAHTVSPAVAVRRRRILVVGAAVLLCFSGLLGADAKLRHLDRQIERLSTEWKSTETISSRNQDVASTYELIAGRWGQRRDWLTDIDAVCRALENDDAVRLVSLQGELGMETGAAEICVSGLASDSSSVPRLLTRCAEDAANVDVFPLGLRPQRSQGLEGVQFELRVSRQEASEKRDGS